MSGVSLGVGVTAVDTVPASGVTGTVGVSQGGTGQTSYTNGQMLIGNTTGNTLTKGTLTQGTDFVITNGTGTVTLGNTAKSVKILGKLTSANLNSTADQAITMTSGVTTGILTNVLITNSSTNLGAGLAAGGIYNATGKPGGGVLLAAATLYTALTAATKFISPAVATLATTDIITSSTPCQFSLTTANGTAATADIYLMGYDLG